MSEQTYLANLHHGCADADEQRIGYRQIEALKAETDRMSAVVAGLALFSYQFTFNVEELNAGRPTSFKTLLIQCQRLVRAAQVAGGDDGA